MSKEIVVRENKIPPILNE
ncbi:hypothetical protein YPPY53_3653, partial [Yersinia pestis PY-53]